VPPTLTFTHGLRIDGGDLTLELLPTPGHRPDHVALWVPELRLVVAGDAAEHPFPCAADAAGLPLLRRSLAQLAQLQPEVVFPCHGGAADAGLLTRNLAYFATLERHVRQARAAGQVATAAAGRADVPNSIGFPVEAAVAAAGGDPGAIPALYRQFHQQNTQAMVGAVLDG
jgi:glyoxylase-like metal-dependent hydrolase (beta-lactamase superfamily II)